MANITTELNNIKNAVYGEQVRGSIHDAIYKINDVNETAQPATVMKTIAPYYDSARTAPYSIGEFVYNNSKLYRCKNPTSGEWKPDDWTEVASFTQDFTKTVEVNNRNYYTTVVLPNESCDNLVIPNFWMIQFIGGVPVIPDWPLSVPGWIRITATNASNLMQQVYPNNLIDYPFSLIRLRSGGSWGEWMKIPIKHKDTELFDNDLANYVKSSINGSTSGITFTYIGHGKMHISGTSTKAITKALYNKSDGFPPSIGPGIAVVPYISSDKVKLNICEYRNGATTGYAVLGSVTKGPSTNYAPITYTESATGARLELAIESGVTIDEDVIIHVWVGNVSDLIMDFVTPATTSVDVEGSGLIFRNGVGERTVYELPNDEQTYEAVSHWLDQHPEATTSVEDYSLNSDVKMVRGNLGYYTPEMFGYTSGDATTYVNSCISAINANGLTKTIRFKKGTYQLNNILLYNGEFEIIIDKNATIMPTSNAGFLFDIGTTGSLKIHGGGKIDVNYISNYIIQGSVQSNQYLTIEDIEIARIKERGINLIAFGGNLTIRNCYVHDMRYKTSSADAAVFCYVAAGQSGSKGNFIFDNNKLIETSYSNQDFLCGAGGVFLSNNNGDKSSAIITNNIFEGLGKSSDTITYSAYIRGAWDSVTISSNVFRNYYECAVAVRDSNNVEIVSNVFKDAVQGYSSNRDLQIGAINYQPSASATGAELYGLIINGNIFKNAPYKVSGSTTTYASFITVQGKVVDNVVQNYANDIVITGNKFDNGRYCILFNGVNNFVFNDNICNTINCATLNYCKGEIIFSGNNITTGNGHAVNFETDSPGAIVNINGNICVNKPSDTTARRLFWIRSVDSCTYTNNHVKTTSTVSTYAVQFTKVDGAQNVGKINVVGNTYEGTNISHNYPWQNIDSVEGNIESSGSPSGVVKPAGAGRCRYYDTTNNKLYMSTGTTNTSWKEIALTTPA